MLFVFHVIYSKCPNKNGVLPNTLHNILSVFSTYVNYIHGDAWTMLITFHLPSNIFQVPKQEWCFTSYSSQYFEHFLTYLNYTPVNYSGKPRPLHNLVGQPAIAAVPFFRLAVLISNVLPYFELLGAVWLDHGGSTIGGCHGYKWFCPTFEGALHSRCPLQALCSSWWWGKIEKDWGN